MGLRACFNDACLNRFRASATFSIPLVLAAACHEARQAPETLSLRQIRPESRSGVYLNERIVLHFSEALDAASVHLGSVRVVSESGEVARGRWLVEGDRLEFAPAPVLSRERTDGGYSPGTEYWVELRGFPAADGLRGESGAPLAQSLRWRFRTVDLRAPRSGPVFEDASPTNASPLVLRTPVIRPFEPIQLTCAEPLDPATIESTDFVLLPQLNLEAVGRTRGDAIPLVARLVRNDEREPYRDDCAVLQLTPRDRRLAPGAYGLAVRRDLRLRDFGGHVVRVLNANFRSELLVRVELGPRLQDETVRRHVESFVDARGRSSAPFGGSDGTALWSDRGRVEPTWPAVAGSGRDGNVELAGRSFVVDVHAARLSVAEEALAEIDAPRGPVLLRSQGALEIAGEFVRGPVGKRPEREEAERALCAFDEWLEEERRRSVPSDICAALERLASRALDATVLVAGGDLVVSGNLRSDSPVILVAGGQIRVGSERQIRAPRVLFHDVSSTALGFTSFVDGEVARALAADFPWSVGGPASNPLVRPVRWSVLSTSIPAGGDKASRWLAEPLVHAHDGQGWAHVSYIGEHGNSHAERVRDVIVDDPAALVDCPTVRLLIELEMFPDVPWDPPWVDDVALEYEIDNGGRER